jgi:hypothetical protein
MVVTCRLLLTRLRVPFGSVKRVGEVTYKCREYDSDTHAESLLAIEPNFLSQVLELAEVEEPAST